MEELDLDPSADLNWLSTDPDKRLELKLLQLENTRLRIQAEQRKRRASASQIVWTAGEMLVITGLDYRQLDYMVKHNMLKPSVKEASGKGSQRLFSSDDAFIGIVAAKLRAHGMDFVAMIPILDRLKHDRELTDNFLVAGHYQIVKIMPLAELKQSFGLDDKVPVRVIIDLGMIRDRLRQWERGEMHVVGGR